jgi:hypothetical protein
MKKTVKKATVDDLKSEYRFDYSKAQPNKYAAKYKAGSRIVQLDPDIAKVFTTPESVNSVLRALIAAMPSQSGR